MNLDRIAPPGVRRYGGAVLYTGIAFGATLVLEPYIEAFTFALFFAAVAVSAWYGGQGPGLTASLLSVAIMQVFFLQPRLSFTRPNVEAWVRIGVVLFVAVLISRLSESLRRSRAEAEAAAERAERLQATTADLYTQAQSAVAARDEVLAFVSHDLRNSLAVVRNAVRLLRRRIAAEEDPDVLEIIGAATDQMDRLAADLVAVSKAEAGRLELNRSEVDGAELVREACAWVDELAAAQGVTVEPGTEPGLPHARADRQRLMDVLQNLLSNAIKFTPAGGRVDVRVAREDDWLRFEVADTGAGIPAEELPHVFDRFWQTRHAGRAGAGLGLAISKGIVEAHGGRIWVESAPGHGTRFHFTIPVASG